MIKGRGKSAAKDFDLDFLPDNLLRQCSTLIESYHDAHGYRYLPDILWRSRLGPFVERHEELRRLLKEASTTRSAKRSNEGFLKIAAVVLALEVLASRFGGWDDLFPEAGERARILLRQVEGPRQTPLMDYYFYPPKAISSSVIAALVLPRK
jgi:hypothetical protein